MHDQSSADAVQQEEAALPTNRKVMKEVSFSLTQEDFANKGKRVAELQQQLGRLSNEIQGIKESFKARMQLIEQDIGHELAVISRGEEIREVEVEERLDYDRGIVEYLHNGAVCDERPMTPIDRQQKMEV